jgi:mevalonate kinase
MENTMKKIRVSVPGKIHFMGEHAVVYGKPALLSAINLRLTVTIQEQDPKKLSQEKIVIISSEPIDHARFAVDFLLDQLQIKDTGYITITIDSQIPAGFHLGSSAAVAVGLQSIIFF